MATDAGREGELIFRYLYHYTGCATPFVRLWISSLTDKAIREGLRNLEAGDKYDNLYLAAKARSESDWLVGINGTQALSIAAGHGTYSVGRVQTWYQERISLADGLRLDAQTERRRYLRP